MGMEYLSLFEPPSSALLAAVARKLGLGPQRLHEALHPQEDYLLVSPHSPIFVVADGVTLERDPAGQYPYPSGAGVVARIFCEETVKHSEACYPHFTQESVPQIFRAANHAVGAYNTAQGRTKASSNFWDFDLFAATGAFVILQGGTAYWAAIADAFVLQLSEEGAVKFHSPGPWGNVEAHLPANWRELPADRRMRLLRSRYRNGVNEQGELIGYGVITGEETAGRYLHYGTLALAEGDFLAVCTDGFEPYMHLPEFIALLTRGGEGLGLRVKQFTAAKGQEDPEQFGQERSLILIAVSR